MKREAKDVLNSATILAGLAVLVSNPKRVERLLRAHAEAYEDTIAYATLTGWRLRRYRARRWLVRLWRRVTRR